MKNIASIKASDITPELLPEYRWRERMHGLSESQIVIDWLDNNYDFPLKPKEEHIRDRWFAARAYFMKGLKYMKILDKLQAEFEISVSQARNDIRNMRHVFGEIGEIPKDVHRQRAISMALDAYKKAKKNNDADAMVKATNTYITAAGIDKDDPDRIDLEKLMQERNYVEVLDPDVRSLIMNFIQQAGGSVDITRFFETVAKAKNAEYINYEEMPAADE